MSKRAVDITYWTIYAIACVIFVLAIVLRSHVLLFAGDASFVALIVAQGFRKSVERRKRKRRVSK